MIFHAQNDRTGPCCSFSSVKKRTKQFVMPTAGFYVIMPANHNENLFLFVEGQAMDIGKIVKSYSHINYVCQVYGPREVEQMPAPADYAFGRFVRIAVRSEQNGDHD